MNNFIEMYLQAELCELKSYLSDKYLINDTDMLKMFNYRINEIEYMLKNSDFINDDFYHLVIVNGKSKCCGVDMDNSFTIINNYYSSIESLRVVNEKAEKAYYLICKINLSENDLTLNVVEAL